MRCKTGAFLQQMLGENDVSCQWLQHVLPRANCLRIVD